MSVELPKDANGCEDERSEQHPFGACVAAQALQDGGGR